MCWELLCKRKTKGIQWCFSKKRLKWKQTEKIWKPLICFFFPLIEKPQISICNTSQRTCRLAAQLCQTSPVSFYGDKSHVTTPPRCLFKILQQPLRVEWLTNTWTCRLVTYVWAFIERNITLEKYLKLEMRLIINDYTHYYFSVPV